MTKATLVYTLLYYTVTTNKKNIHKSHGKALTNPIQGKKKKLLTLDQSGDHFTWSTRTTHQHQNTTWPALSSQHIKA
jgi:hypothetical protein